jgi:hypothetical protein
MKPFIQRLVLLLATALSVIAAPDSSPFDKLKTESAVKAGNKGLSITELWNGYNLECRMQNLQAEVTMSGTKIRSVSLSEGLGVFSIQAAKLGRDNLMENISSSADFVDVDAGVIRSGRGNIVEEYTASGDGIRQDFVIVNKPEGKGLLVLELDVTGADAALAGDAIKIRIAGNRELVYHALNVTDATGMLLDARFKKVENNLITITVDDKSARYPVRIDPTITDADWISMGGIPGVEGSVTAVALDSSGNLYVGGYLTIAGNVFAHNIVKWDGMVWSTLGGGVNGTVNDIKVDNSGNLYVGGGFDTAGGIPAKYVAKWDGAQWSALGSGTNSGVSALAIDDSGNVYASGSFTLAGGMSANRIARWSGSAWNSLGSGVISPTYANKCIYAVAVDHIGNVYAGGDFDTIGGVVAHRIARWDGASWHVLDSGVRTSNLNRTALVIALTVDSLDNLYAGGAFDTAGRTFVRGIAKWDGSAWSAVGDGIGGSYSMVRDIEFDTSGNLYACGYFSANYGLDSGGIMTNSIARWNGTTWSALGSGIISGNGLTSITLDNSGSVYAGGYFNVAGGIAANNIAKWDGGSWSAFGSGTNSNVRALALDSSGNLYAGGSFLSIAGIPANHIAKWDGSVWSALGSGMNAEVFAVAIDKSNRVYVMGSFDSAGGKAANHIAGWDGNVWSALGSGLSCGKGFFGSLAVDDSGDVYVGSDYDSAGGITVNNIAKWDGSAWSSLGSGTNGGVYALMVDGTGNLYAGGAFDSAGGIRVNQVARWDGSAWSALDSGVGGWWGDGCVYAFVLDGAGNLYATGEFDSAGGKLVNNIAKWDGREWSALGIGLNVLMDFDMDEIGAFAIAVDNSGDVYAGGDFKQAGGIAVNQIARWDGSAWSAMGSGIEKLWYGIHSMVIDKSGSIYIGGNFLYAGNKVSPYIARCNLAGTAVLPGNIAKKSVACPAFNLHSGTVNFNLVSAAQVTYCIYTLSGKQVLQTSKSLNAGNHVLRINTGKMARGVYILHLKAGNGSMRLRMAIDK